MIVVPMIIIEKLFMIIIENVRQVGMLRATMVASSRLTEDREPEPPASGFTGQ
jgi:hypothetical protein